MKKLIFLVLALNLMACYRTEQTEIAENPTNITKAPGNGVPKVIWAPEKKHIRYEIHYNSQNYLVIYTYATAPAISIKQLSNNKTVTFSKVSGGIKVQSGTKSKTYSSGQNIPLLEWLSQQMRDVMIQKLYKDKKISLYDLVTLFQPGQWPGISSQANFLDNFNDEIFGADCYESHWCNCGDGLVYTKSCPCSDTVVCAENWTEPCYESPNGTQYCETYDYCQMWCE